MLARATLAAAIVAAASFAALAHAAATTSSKTYPSSIVVLGDSGATGYASNPKHPGRDAPENSWATGTNPAVKSIYARILAANPAIRGHNRNLAQDGATLKELAAQVRTAVTLKPAPQLVLVQIMDDVMHCDGQDDTRYGAFKAELTATLLTLAKGLPKARIFMVGRWGTLSSYIKAVQSLGLGVRLEHAGKGPCSIFEPRTGRVVPEHVAYLKRITNGYHAAMADACAQVPTCRHDRGVARRLVVTAADLGWRHQHLSIQGQAKLAAGEWTALNGK
jgi:hypothetical protein